MAEPRGKKAADVVEEVTGTGERGPVEASTEEFNQHVKNLVSLYSQEIVAELEERVSDLERLVVENPGAVTFVPLRLPETFAEGGVLPEAEPYEEVAPAQGGAAPWYKPD